MKKLLVPCDSSDSALLAVRLAVARALSEAAVEIHLLHVIEPMTPVTLSEAFSARQLDERFPPQAAQALAPAVAALPQSGVRYTLHCCFGLPATEIAAYAESAGCDEIIMGTHGRGALANLVTGSVATQVVKLLDIPVTLVKMAPCADSGTKKVLVPFDGSDSALRALRYAARLAHDHPEIKLDLLHVLDPGTHRVDAALSSEDPTRRSPDAFASVLRPARELLDADGVSCEVHCRAGDPARQIADHIARAGSTAVVMGTRGLGLMGNLVIGSVASRVVHYAQVPVTLIK